MFTIFNSGSKIGATEGQAANKKAIALYQDDFLRGFTLANSAI